MGQRLALIVCVLLQVGCASAEPPAQQVAVSEPFPAVVESAAPETPAQITTPVIREPPQATPGPSRKAKLEKREEPKAVAPTPLVNEQALIAHVLRQSRARYSGNCACPDDRDRAGRRCGARSAYSKPGGASPLCFPHDVTPTMLETARQELAGMLVAD